MPKNKKKYCVVDSNLNNYYHNTNLYKKTISYPREGFTHNTGHYTLEGVFVNIWYITNTH